MCTFWGFPGSPGLGARDPHFGGFRARIGGYPQTPDFPLYDENPAQPANYMYTFSWGKADFGGFAKTRTFGWNWAVFGSSPKWGPPGVSGSPVRGTLDPGVPGESRVPGPRARARGTPARGARPGVLGGGHLGKVIREGGAAICRSAFGRPTTLRVRYRSLP